jgi:hypothetical protein
MVHLKLNTGPRKSLFKRSNIDILEEEVAICDNSGHKNMSLYRNWRTIGGICDVKTTRSKAVRREPRLVDCQIFTPTSRTEPEHSHDSMEDTGRDQLEPNQISELIFIREGIKMIEEFIGIFPITNILLGFIGNGSLHGLGADLGRRASGRRARGTIAHSNKTFPMPPSRSQLNTSFRQITSSLHFIPGRIRHRATVFYSMSVVFFFKPHMRHPNPTSGAHRSISACEVRQHSDETGQAPELALAPSDWHSDSRHISRGGAETSRKTQVVMCWTDMPHAKQSQWPNWLSG